MHQWWSREKTTFSFLLSFWSLFTCNLKRKRITSKEKKKKDEKEGWLPGLLRTPLYQINVPPTETSIRAFGWHLSFCELPNYFREMLWHCWMLIETHWSVPRLTSTQRMGNTPGSEFLQCALLILWNAKLCTYLQTCCTAKTPCIENALPNLFPFYWNILYEKLNQL